MSRTIPMADPAAQYASLRGAIDEAVARVLASGRYVGGEEVAAFERALASRLAVREAVGTASGTAALHVALIALGLGAGDEVVVPAYTFCATVEAVLHTGATARLVDVDAEGNLDPGAVEAALTERTRAVIAVHFLGRPADLARLGALARDRGLWLVEDAAQAFGGRAGERCLGTVGHLGCFSFFPAKILGAVGDAGAVATDDADRAAAVRALVDHGRLGRGESERLGFNYRLDALQAAVLRVKLERVDDWLAVRRRLSRRYCDGLGDLPLRLPTAEPGHAHQSFAIQLDGRDALAAWLRDRGIATAIHYRRPLHRHRAFADLPRGPLPTAERLAARSLCLPLHPELSGADQDRVIEAVRAYFRS